MRATIIKIGARVICYQISSSECLLTYNYLFLGNIEIRESFDENEEKEWRIKHRQRVKEAKISEKETVPDNQEADDDLWRRLDEL